MGKPWFTKCISEISRKSIHQYQGKDRNAMRFNKVFEKWTSHSANASGAGRPAALDVATGTTDAAARGGQMTLRKWFHQSSGVK